MFKFNMFSVCLVAFWAVFQVVTSFRCPLQNCGFLLFKYWPFVNLKIWLIIQGLAKKRRPGIQIGTDSTFIIICAAACRLPPAACRFVFVASFFWRQKLTPFKDDEKMKSFTLRYPGWLEARLTAATASRSVSKNQFIVQLLERELQ